MNLEHVESLIDNGDPEAALAQVRPLVDCRPHDGRLRILAARAYVGVCRYEDAMREYEEATVLQPLPALAQAQLAYCYLRCRQRQLTSLLLARLLPYHGVICEEALSIALKSGCKINHFKTIRDGGRNGRARFPNNPIFWFAGGELFKNIPERAEHYYSRASELAPQNVDYRIAVAQQQLALDDIDAALKTLDFDLGNVRCLANLQRVQLLHSAMDNTDGYFECHARLVAEYERILDDPHN